MPPNFELVFSIPHHHRLVLIRSRARGGVWRGVYWTHEQMDQSGSVAARYESSEEVSRTGQVQCGWRKYDSFGTLVDEQIFAESWPLTAGTQPHEAAQPGALVACFVGIALS